MVPVNDNLILICGESAGGKSASLRTLLNPEHILYLNCEANKKLPFPAKFKQFSITDPKHIISGIDEASERGFHTVVIDTLTFLMDMYESKYVIGSTNTMQAWSDFAQYFKNLMQENVARSPCNIIFTAHVQAILNEADMILAKKVPIKGALKANGIEAYFSTVISARTIPVLKLQDYKNSLLTITPEEEAIGFKYVFQTKLTKETVHERIRSPIGMWTTKETFIDNDAQLVLTRLQEYYK